MTAAIHDWVPGGGPETWPDDLASHGDDLRDVVDPDWRPDPKDLA